MIFFHFEVVLSEAYNSYCHDLASTLARCRRSLNFSHFNIPVVHKNRTKLATTWNECSLHCPLYYGG